MSKTEWYPIETCPKNGSYLLWERGTHPVNDPGGVVIGYYDPDCGDGEWVNDYRDCVFPAYWTELPDSPEIR